MRYITSAILICFSTLFSQNFNLSGTITDAQNGDPLIGANVVISNKDFNTGAATNSDGEYTIQNVPLGDYTLKVTYIGYEDYEAPIAVNENSVNFNIQLNISAIQLQEYIVTASRGRREKITDAPAAISLISELKIRNASNPNLGDYFKNIKGVDFTASGLDSYNLSARGFNSSFSSRLLTLTDGRMANVPSLRLIAYNVIPLTSDDVKQIEVVLGPSSALYGPNAHAGVVNIISKRPQESKGTVLGITGGTRNFSKAQVRHSGSIGNLGYKMSLVQFNAYDWEYIEDDEKKAHYKQWQDRDGNGDELDDLFEDGLAWWDGWDIKVDRDGNGTVDTTYLGSDNKIYDRNADGIDDIPHFNINNTRFDIRTDYDFSPDHFISLNYGFAQATNINITGIGRYLADDWIYQFFQARWVYKNWFAQAYLNTSLSGDTRNIRTGGVVTDHSKFFHFQFQHNKDFKFLDTKLIWGGDYQRTMPKTFGTILPDGTGGNNPISYDEDGIDNDKDGEVDEWDELLVTNEFGLYGQTQSKLGDKFQLILSGRVDLHSGQQKDGGITFLEDPLTGETMEYYPQISPKVGLLYKPNENQTFRLTAARAFNTPSSQGLYLDVLAAQYSVFPVKARGNANGYNYTRNANGQLMMFDVRAGSQSEFRWSDMPEGSVLYIPAVLGRSGQFVNAEDYTKIKPVRSEEIWTYEFGYAGFIGKKTRATFDFYYSTYSDFVSDLTWVTPVVLDTSAGFYSVDNPDPKILGFIPTAQHSGIKDGGDGIPGYYYVKYGTSVWSSVIPSGWWQRPIEQRNGTSLHIVNGDTLGAWWTDDQTDFDYPVELMLTNINYGAVSLWGMDASIYTFITPKISADINFSFLGKTRFWNFLTRSYDPINAPKYKVNAKVAYTAEQGFHGNLGFRYIPEFEWSAGVHYGIIDQYLVFDTMVGYRFAEKYDLILNINNLNGDIHREIIGGPKLGRHITLKLNARF
tara:strand:+ start:27245 stop:30163 length:2919 start_codon:yes stop_codon:yes gene_type:complete